MILIDESFSKEIVQKIIENEKIELTRKLQAFDFQKKILMSYTQSITNTLEKLEYFENTQKLSELFSDFKSHFNKMYSIDSKFPEVFEILENLSLNSNKNNYIKNYEKYNTNLASLQKELDIFSNDLSKFMENLKEFVEFKFLNTYSYEEKNNNASTQENQSQTQKPYSSTETFSESTLPANITDNNCLLISEIENKVFLPYKVKSLNEKLANSFKYSNISEIIEKEYILPLNRFKNPILSRFKESYNLMKNKEKSSFLEALDLALELSLNSTLNPAVISACQTKTELDIYLDCLYENELEKFKIFNIKYEINPTIK